MAPWIPGPTLTAIGVAGARALYSSLPGPLGIVNDPMASKLVPLPMAALARAAAFGTERTSHAVHALLARATAGMTTNIALRTVAIDDMLRGALKRGAAQAVLLGSGLDARAWRMPELRDTNVYELDRPAAHRYKLERLGARTGARGAHRMVAIDFERESIDGVLRSAGHDATRPTVWLWEGVVVYLTPEAVDATLESVGGCSSAGSTLIATYTEPNLGQGQRITLHWRAAARLVGEPVRGETSTRDLHRKLGSFGFDVVRDEGNLEAIVRYWGRAWESYAAGWERIVEAVRS